MHKLRATVPRPTRLRSMKQGVDERIFGLIKVAQDQQAAVRAGIEGLALGRAALAKDRVTLIPAAE